MANANPLIRIRNDAELEYQVFKDKFHELYEDAGFWITEVQQDDGTFAPAEAAPLSAPVEAPVAQPATKPVASEPGDAAAPSAA